MKSLMEVLGGATDSGDSTSSVADGSDTPASDTSPDQKEAISSLALDCFHALKENDQEGFADNLVAMIEMVR